VGTTTSSTLRHLASNFTSSMTGNAPAPVPMTSLASATRYHEISSDRRMKRMRTLLARQGVWAYNFLSFAPTA
jgi:hypothetical protein